ncbi:hypothetical protein FB446DRAFT_709276 [Lentinula raphanica]|nr:hypothetical protein FB446DRAFT_709276 [Lentinula raphanica]
MKDDTKLDTNLPIAVICRAKPFPDVLEPTGFSSSTAAIIESFENRPVPVITYRIVEPPVGRMTMVELDMGRAWDELRGGRMRRGGPLLDLQPPSSRNFHTLYVAIFVLRWQQEGPFFIHTGQFSLSELRNFRSLKTLHRSTAGFWYFLGESSLSKGGYIYCQEPSLSKGGSQWQIAKLYDTYRGGLGVPKCYPSAPISRKGLDDGSSASADRPPSALGEVGGILAPKVVSPFGFIWVGETEIGDKCGSAPMASAKHLPRNGKEDWESYGSHAVVAYTNSGPWQQWIVSICWPERTKSSVGGNSSNIISPGHWAFTGVKPCWEESIETRSQGACWDHPDGDQ